MDKTISISTTTITAVQMAERAIREGWREANGDPAEVLPPAGTLHYYECSANGEWYYRVACADECWREVPRELDSIAAELLRVQGPTPPPRYSWETSQVAREARDIDDRCEHTAELEEHV